MRRLALPRLTRGRRLPAAALVGFCILAFYELPMHVRVVPATRLTPSTLDLAVPFLEWTVWIYWSYLAFLFAPLAVCVDDGRAARVTCALMINSFLAGVVFLLWPTEGEVQMPVADGVTGLLWQFLLAVDRPTNLLPSLHVANACTCALALSRERNGWRVAAPLWCLLIAASTLTTKQHLAIDLPTGAALGVLSVWLVDRLSREEEAAAVAVRQ